MQTGSSQGHPGASWEFSAPDPRPRDKAGGGHWPHPLPPRQAACGLWKRASGAGRGQQRRRASGGPLGLASRPSRWPPRTRGDTSGCSVQHHSGEAFWEWSDASPCLHHDEPWGPTGRSPHTVPAVPRTVGAQTASRAPSRAILCLKLSLLSPCKCLLHSLLLPLRPGPPPPAPDHGARSTPGVVCRVARHLGSRQS